MKKVLFAALFLLFTSSVFFADDIFSDDKHYSDEAAGYEGWCSLAILGTADEMKSAGLSYETIVGQLKNEFVKKNVVTDCAKLSKCETFLANSVLKDCSCKEGIFYFILISTTPPDVTKKALCLIVTVSEGGKDFDWRGFYIAEHESENKNGVDNDEFKHYYDKFSGFEGWAQVEFMGLNSELEKQGFSIAIIIDAMKEEARKAGEPVFSDCHELSKLETFLVWSALEEYDYEDGELYVIGITTEDPGRIEKALCLFVKITDGGSNFVWDGLYIIESPDKK